MRRLTVGITGASGALYARRLLLSLMQSSDVDGVDLVVSSGARQTLLAELDVPVEGALDLAALLGQEPQAIELCDNKDIGSSIASGSHPSLGMVIVPCSMASLARVAQGISDSLLTRAADVCLKERRKLILVTRESPLSLIHMRNMLSAAEAGATIIPAAPPFYHRPKTIDELVDQLLARVLDHLGVEHKLGKRWQGMS